MTKRIISKIGIIIPTPSLNNENITTCLESLEKTTYHLDIEIKPVVDSGENFRFSKSVNRGLKELPNCDAWALVNDDCVFQPGWLDELIKTAKENVQAGLIGAIVETPEGEIEHAGGYLTTSTIDGMKNSMKQGRYFRAIRMPFRNIIFRGAESKIEPFHYLELNISNRLYYLTGSCLLITRELFEAIGLWDEDFIFTWEDTDYGLRCLEAGFELALSTNSRVSHRCRATGTRWSRKIWESGRIFREKWPSSRIREVVDGRLGIYD